MIPGTNWRWGTGSTWLRPYKPVMKTYVDDFPDIVHWEVPHVLLHEGKIKPLQLFSPEQVMRHVTWE